MIAEGSDCKIRPHLGSQPLTLPLHVITWVYGVENTANVVVTCQSNITCITKYVLINTLTELKITEKNLLLLKSPCRFVILPRTSSYNCKLLISKRRQEVQWNSNLMFNAQLWQLIENFSSTLRNFLHVKRISRLIRDLGTE